MIELPLQINPGHKTLSVTSAEDRDALKAYHPNQLVKAKLYGIKKPRSYQQLKLYFACCRTVARNLEGKTEDDVDFDTRVELKFIKAFRVLPNGTMIIQVDSISYANLPHIQACKYFDRAFPVMAKMIGVPVDKLLENTQQEGF